MKLFSKLTGINMFSAMAWAFRAKAPEGKKPVRLLFYFTIFTYLISFTIFFVFLFFLPKRVFDMNQYHAGGLLGYRDVGVKVYDPSQHAYVAYPVFFAPLPANKFTETFEVVLLYKQPSDNYYQTTELMSLYFNLPGLIAGVLFLALVYIILFSLAKEYKRKKLSHHFMADQFRKIVGIAPWKALVIFLSIFVLILGISAISIKRLIYHYSNIYGSHQKAFRSAQLKKVSPQDTLTGYVIRRFQSRESETSSTQSADGRRTRQETTYYTVFHYTVEFRDLIHIPVYLNLELHEAREEVKVLNKHFPDTMTVVPSYIKEYAFIVNPDYSISLKRDVKEMHKNRLLQ
ncbi:MAG: hypothetical protein A2176_03415 [Spirochaetes bacterium RBG_13_51_14]|nr:MAG: hypothetical protein A2176_03415 [Spirochaetes bacterium RBG_13_51_14]